MRTTLFDHQTNDDGLQKNVELEAGQSQVRSLLILFRGYTT